jgi:aromatic amino acid aminotransferase I
LSLGPGAPSPQYYPFDHINVQVPSIPSSDAAKAVWDETSFTINKYDMKGGKSGYGMSDIECSIQQILIAF